MFKYIMAGLYLFGILLGNYFVIEYGILNFNIQDVNNNILFSLSAPAGVDRKSTRLNSSHTS